MLKEIIELHSLPVRILHWTQVFIIITLIICGFYIHYPGLLNIPFSTIKNIKGVFNFLLIINSSLYIYYSIISKHYLELIFSFRDIRFIPVFFKYIFFLKDEPGYYGKYNPGQKATYTFWFLLILVQIFTGLTLFYPETFGFFVKLLGGLNRIRITHYFATWLFVFTIPIHLYLAITEDPAKLQSIFTGYARR
ncbi:MAG: Ni/Fe-hydrogenase 1 B-type cytochrome subunit [Clostridia bacterium]|jgi:Ni/Fe-hydrogenase 1 B-type cytochrome subunit|nr:Ni/Fe-hydrogenase 1 B-type cytochrome subunit [Clostridia bacterium]MDN5323309.1 Ni/Fe-hydrogenase 1 B-type cytochrome subunit [Clostridia bacterium]